MITTDGKEYQKINLLFVMQFTQLLYIQQLDRNGYIKNKTANETTRIVKQIFVKFGISDTIVTDTVPFNSAKVKQFAKENGSFEPIFTNPLHSR